MSRAKALGPAGSRQARQAAQDWRWRGTGVGEGKSLPEALPLPRRPAGVSLAAVPAPPPEARDAGAPGAQPAGLVRERISQPSTPTRKPRTASTPFWAKAPKPPKIRSVEACQRGAWHILSGPRAEPGSWKPRRFRCCTWRCEGECAKRRSQQDFRRLEQALLSQPLGSLVWGVLTLDPSRLEPVTEPHPDAARAAAGETHTRQQNVDEVYRGLVTRWTKLARALRKAFGDFEYCTVTEAHRNGLPHVNFIIVSQGLRAMRELEPPSEADVQAGRGPRWWRELATAAGWGYRTTLDPVAGVQEVASYCTKAEKGAVASPSIAGAEVVKLSQVPTVAPRKFRRFRSSKGFLPPVLKDPEVSGALLQTPAPEIQLSHQAQRVAELDAIWGAATLERARQPARSSEGWQSAPSVDDACREWMLKRGDAVLSPLRPWAKEDRVQPLTHCADCSAPRAPALVRYDPDTETGAVLCRTCAETYADQDAAQLRLERAVEAQLYGVAGRAPGGASAPPAPRRG